MRQMASHRSMSASVRPWFSLPRTMQAVPPACTRRKASSAISLGERATRRRMVRLVVPQTQVKGATASSKVRAMYACSTTCSALTAVRVSKW